MCVGVCVVGGWVYMCTCVCSGWVSVGAHGGVCVVDG